jgi:hypothetical protein
MTINCPNCQLEIPQQSEFCPECGALIPAPNSQPLAARYSGWPPFSVLLALVIYILYHVKHPIPLLITFLLHVVILILHITPYVAIGIWQRVEVTELGLFFGGSLFRFRVGPCVIRLNWCPIGAYVKFRNADQTHENGQGSNSTHGKPFTNLRPGERLLLNISPIIFLLIISCTILGPTTAFQSFIRGFAQIFQGALSPRQFAIPLASSFVLLITQGRFLAAMAILATKEAAINSLPFPLVSGGAILLELRNAIFGRPVQTDGSRNRLITVLEPILVLIIFLIAAVWLLALLAAVGFDPKKNKFDDHFPRVINFSTSSLDGSAGCAPNPRQHAAPAAFPNFTASRISFPSDSATAIPPKNASPAAVVSTTLTFSPLTVSIYPP